MTSAKQIVRLLMTTDEPYFKRLTETMLQELCNRLHGTVALFHVIDEQKILLKDKFGTEDGVNINFPLIYGSASESLCLSETFSVRGSDQKSEGACPKCTLSSVFHDAGFQSYLCVPLYLKSVPMGILSVLWKEPKQFTHSELDFLALRGKHLALALHHLAYFPEMIRDWTDFAEMQALGESKPGVDHQNSGNGLQTEGDDLLSRVLAQERANGSTHPSSVIGPLPKGISFPTLKHVCQVLEGFQGRISRKALAKALGCSDVTAGHYLKYLVNLGMMEERTTYGSVGRPTFMYVLERNPTENVRPGHPCPFDWEQDFSPKDRHLK